MSAATSLKPAPTYRPGEDYNRENERRHRNQISVELDHKHDKRSHLYVGQDKFLIFTSPGFIDFRLGISDSGILSITNDTTDAVGTFIINWNSVEGLAQELTNLQTGYQAGDATLQASVTSNAGLISVNSGLIAGIETEIISARSGETDLLARFNSIVTAYTGADSAEAAARLLLQSTLEGVDANLQAQVSTNLSTQISDNAARVLDISNANAASAAAQADATSALNLVATEQSSRITEVSRLETEFRGRDDGPELLRNSRFQAGVLGAVGVPYGWVDWVRGTIITQSADGAGGHGLVSKQNTMPNESMGILQDAFGIVPLADYILTAKVRRRGGSFNATGVYVEWYSSGYAGIVGSSVLTLRSETSLEGSTGAYPDGTNTYSLPVQAPASAAIARVYAMAQWAGHGSQTTGCEVDWYECSIKPLGYSEAGVSEIREALAAGSSSFARLQLRVNTATNAATFEAYAGQGDGVWNGSYISFTANEFRFNGDVIVNGTITADQIASNAISEPVEDPFTNFDMTLTDSNWVTPATLDAVDVGGVAILTWSFDFNWSAFGGGGGSQFGDVEIEILRNGTAIITKSIPYSTNTNVSFGWTGEWESDDFDLVSGTDVVYSVRMRHVRDAAWSPFAPATETRQVSGNLKAVAFKR